MFKLFASLPAAPDFNDPNTVVQWQLERVRRIGYAFTIICLCCAFLEHVFGAPVVAAIYGLNALLIAGFTAVLQHGNRLTVGRLAVGAVCLTCLSTVLIADRLINVCFLLSLLCFTSVHEDDRRWRSLWIGVYAASFTAVCVHFARTPALVTGPGAYMQCALTVACMLTMLAFLMYDYLKISRETYAGYAALNEQLGARVDLARATQTELRDQLTVGKRVTRSIGQSVASAHDMRARLEASHEQLEQFAYAASHDLKEPVRTIKSFMRMAERKMPPEARADTVLAEHFAYIQSNADAMHEVLDRLLVYSRATRVEASAKTCSLQRVWQQAVVKTGLPTAVMQAHLQTLAAHSATELVSDPAKLQAIFSEVLSNAVRFVAPGAAPHFTIDFEPPTNTHVVCKVTDRGIGFAPEYTEQVFGLFQRLHPREQYASAGVGLAIVRQVGRQIGVEVAISSEIGVGTTVHFTIPLRI